MKQLLFACVALSPALLMLIVKLLSLIPAIPIRQLWRMFIILSGVAFMCALITSSTGQQFSGLHQWLSANPLSNGLALLVQLLGTVIIAFSTRYLNGEPGQRRYVEALAGMLAAVHLLLMANHWVVLITAWTLVGVALQHLLCFYPDRPFALLASHKKRIADWGADVLLVGAGALAWVEVGSGSFSDLWIHIRLEGMSTTLQICAVCLVLAVILRTALLPFHGWLIQVMEAPTPVSALLHAGVVNLGGYVLISFAPLLEHAMPARSLLVAFGLITALLAGLVMLTRISIKVRLAWSTVAQMGFMVLECGLGLYSLAALHLIGHSLYKAHAFLSASMIVRETRLQLMRGTISVAPISLLLAPIVAVTTVWLIQSEFSRAAWPWWWSAIIGLAWAPLLWLPAHRSSIWAICFNGISGLLMVAILTSVVLLARALPLGIHDTPNQVFGEITLIGMAMLYLCLVVLQLRPQALRAWRRWSYAGFYVDEIFTRLALQLWPTHWTPGVMKTCSTNESTLVAADAP